MFKLLAICSVMAVVVASPLGGCGTGGDGFAKIKELGLTDAQKVEIKNIFAEAVAPGSTVTKAQVQAKLDAIKATLSPEQQAIITEITPTGIPNIPTNLSPEAQSVADAIKAVVANQDNTIAQDREQVKSIVEAASPAVQAELKAVRDNCVAPTGSA